MTPTSGPPRRASGPASPASGPAGRAFLAVDGGNSKTDVLVADTSGALLAHVRGAGYRPHEGGFDRAVDTVADLVNRALADAGGPPPALVSAYMANVDLPDEERALVKALRDRGWTDRVTVGNDTFALLHTGARRGWGVAVVCGAGINCVGVAPDGARVSFPSLGAHTGDWGGGGTLGEAALWHAVRAEDGRGPATALTAAVAAHFGAASAVDVGIALHVGDIHRDRLLALTPVLMDVAEAGDQVALSVVDRQAEEIALLGTAALRRLGLLDRPTEVVLGGGVLSARRPPLMAGVERRFAGAAPHAELIVADAPPVLGAALLALAELAADEPPEDGADERLRAACARRWTPPGAAPGAGRGSPKKS
ncbi:N-acetylglucosamine kinase [Actinomadura rupiterrae]|uniref:N-acetylglucosamine kinase n=1 Tax=Actinomadura rupiterrae TaxID=559627 RepID=UPI0020A2D1F5|nr:BadF/BadG/BcrA/BcrD ATPase family protein [Actinomadura rupiterrae]MCP2342679.1 N-acetylglucosamine kinase-like BadF-type ATPase [Actinomadura rupiterrae]